MIRKKINATKKEAAESFETCTENSCYSKIATRVSIAGASYE